MSTETRQYTITAEKELLDKIEKAFDEAIKPVKKKKPEWEIIAFRNKYYGTIWKRGDHNKFHYGLYSNGDSPEEFFLRNASFYEIDSIKRFSDEEVFNIGDRVQDKYLSDPINGIIEEFKIDPEFALGLGVRISGENPCIITLDHLQKYKKPEPLFITEDGKELFSPTDTIYSVLPKAQWDKKEFNVSWVASAQKAFGAYKAWKHFSSLELRDQYILENKPVLSLKDVRGLVHHSWKLEELDKLVKSKL